MENWTNHFWRPNDLGIETNRRFPTLEWEDEVCEEMPIVRANYVELQAAMTIHLVDCDARDKRERTERWQKLVLTHSLMTWVSQLI
jgi:hypothetical protein